MKERCREEAPCRTGEVKVTEGFDLPVRYVLHTVGPRYNVKYKTAAESALFNSYRSILQIVKEQGVSTLGLVCVHSAQRGYPSDLGVHIALRVVRRWLEKNPTGVSKIIFVVSGKSRRQRERRKGRERRGEGKGGEGGSSRGARVDL